MTNTLFIFIILNVLNVVIQTIKSLATVKCGKGIASLVNAVAYGLYTVVLVYMNCNMPLWEKVLIVGSANLVGVYIVKYLEEKGRKEKIWKIEFAVNNGYTKEIENRLTVENISYSYNTFNNKSTFITFADNQEETKVIKNIIKQYNAKYFITETRNF